MSDAADAPLDERDTAVLAELAATYSAVDPPPSDLDARVSFALALQHGDLELEVARLTEDVLVGAGTRAAEQPRTMTFDCPSLTLMVAVVVLPRDQRRIDGWLAPAGPLVVDVRVGGSAAVTQTVTADAAGRFVVDSVPAGLAQLTVHLPRSPRAVVTPAVVL
jgi:hypothetical protein